jgi:hypothetical protein
VARSESGLATIVPAQICVHHTPTSTPTTTARRAPQASATKNECQNKSRRGTQTKTKTQKCKQRKRNAPGCKAVDMGADTDTDADADTVSENGRMVSTQIGLCRREGQRCRMRMRTRKTGTIRARRSACALQDIAIRVSPGLLPVEREAARSTCLAGPTYNDPTAARTFPARAGARGRTRGRKGERDPMQEARGRKGEDRSGIPARQHARKMRVTNPTAPLQLLPLTLAAVPTRHGSSSWKERPLQICPTRRALVQGDLALITATHDVLPALSGEKLPHRTSQSTASTAPRLQARLARHALPTPHRQRRTHLIHSAPAPEDHQRGLSDALPPRFSARRKTRNQKNAKQNAPDSNSAVAPMSMSTGAAHFGLSRPHFARILNWVLRRHRQRIRVHRPHTGDPSASGDRSGRSCSGSGDSWCGGCWRRGVHNSDGCIRCGPGCGAVRRAVVAAGGSAGGSCLFAARTSAPAACGWPPHPLPRGCDWVGCEFEAAG